MSKQELGIIEFMEVEKFPVRDSWLQGCREGVGLIPQRNNIIGITATAAVLNDPPSDWSELEQSEPDAQQLKKLGNMLNRMHESYRIEVSVSESRLKELWNNTVPYVYRNIHILEQQLSLGDFNPVNNSDTIAAELNSLFCDTERSEQVQFIKEIVRTLRDACFSQEGKDLAAVYRATYSRIPGMPINIRAATRLHQIQEEYPTRHPQDVSLNQFIQHVRDYTGVRFPEFQNHTVIDWLLKE